MWRRRKAGEASWKQIRADVANGLCKDLDWSHRPFGASLCSWTGTDLLGIGAGKFNSVVVPRGHWRGRRESNSLETTAGIQVGGEEAVW